MSSVILSSGVRKNGGASFLQKRPSPAYDLFIDPDRMQAGDQSPLTRPRISERTRMQACTALASPNVTPSFGQVLWMLTWLPGKEATG